MVDPRDHDVGCALEFRPGKGDVGGRAALADPQPVWLGELVVVVGADGQPFDRPGHFVPGRILGLVQLGEERAAAGEFASAARTVERLLPLLSSGERGAWEARRQEFQTRQESLQYSSVGETSTAVWATPVLV